MADTNFLQLTISFLGGGTVAGIINLVYSAKSASKIRKIDKLTKELQFLYGPLFYFVSQNEDMFNLNSKFHKAYQEEYTGQNWSKDEHTQKALKEKTSVTLDIANKYVDVVTKNNDKIVEILNSNYSYIDPDDVEIFQQFMVDYTRMQTEVDTEGILQTPLEIYTRLDTISFMRPEFIERVKTKFINKKQELTELN